jgi:hypothetical protein
MYRTTARPERLFLKKIRANPQVKSSQVNTLPKAKSKTRSKQNKDMQKCSSVYSERGVPLPVLTSGGELVGVRTCKMPPASHQVSATSLKLLIQQIHPNVRVERDSNPR